MEFKNDDQLRSYLKSESKRLGISIKNTYNTYFSRVLLERLNKTCYDELFVKGSFSTMAHLNTIIRPITDIDLVSTKYHNDPLIALFRAMCDTNENLYYELIDIPKQTKTGIYKIHITANYGKIKHPISIDFQELSNTVYEKDYKVIDPLFKGDERFYIYTPTYEEYLAEKLCIVVENNKPDVLNTRVKDFYDIYKLNGGKYNKERLLYFFYHMLLDRKKIDINDASTNHLNEKYIARHSDMWDCMKVRYEFLDDDVNFGDSVEVTKQLVDNQLSNMDKAKEMKIRLR